MEVIWLIKYLLNILIDKGVSLFFLLIIECRNVNMMMNVSKVFVIIFYLGFMFCIMLRIVDLFMMVLYIFSG